VTFPAVTVSNRKLAQLALTRYTRRMITYSDYAIEYATEQLPEDTLHKLQDNVSRMMQDGFQPVGGVSVVYCKDTDYYTASQAIARAQDL